MKYTIKKIGHKKYVLVPVSTSYQTYLYGDFDSDSIKNIDDTDPFSKTNPHLHTKSLYFDPIVKMSEELKAMYNYNKSFVPIVNKFLRQNPDAVGRVKSVPSTLKKLREKALQPYRDAKTKKWISSRIKDTAGVRFQNSIPDKKAVYAKTEEMRARYNFDPKESNDYYKKPLGGFYRGIHTGLLFGKGAKEHRVEMQVRSGTLGKIYDWGHDKYYKKGMKFPKKLIRQVNKEARKGA